MSFWNLNDGNDPLPTDGAFESGGGNMEPIPADTSVLAVADEAKWDHYGDEPDYISLRWSILRPDEYKNRKVFQKIRVNADDPKKADKAKRMLAAIDANAGGKLVAAGEMPTDESMTRCLTNKPMVLKLQVWELDDKSKSGNWVAAVSPRKGPPQAAAKEPEPVKEPVTAPDTADDFSGDDDIPF